MHSHFSEERCVARRPSRSTRRERGVHAVVALTAVTMVAELAVGHATGSMALLADGWHMATHVAALGMASLAYVVARRLESQHAFSFGSGKVHTLAGFTSSLVLAIASMWMIFEALTRLAHPHAIDVAHSLPVAVAGLLVNVISIKLLHVEEDAHPHAGHDHDHAHHDHAHHDHHHHHDHNHRAAVMHVMADILTSALAIVALLAAQHLGWTWLDPLTGLIGGLVVAKWSVDLCRSTALELLDLDASAVIPKIRAALEKMDDVRVHDLHVWSLGRGIRCCVVTVHTTAPRAPAAYHRTIREVCQVAHLTVEVQPHAAPQPVVAP
ncbi:MAG: CDF family Co(II)/Ni(II) efflux transporter DmeF [Kofleriaceae bacterium]|nr:CDF family Co(II)/Ni(II) efflux transporter DmeF [Kofleriaceae bacterium]